MSLARYTLPRQYYRQLTRYAHRAQRRDQSEICGAIIEASRGDLELEFLKNYAKIPGRFEIDLADLTATSRRAKIVGKRLAGTFHSHPISEAVPSSGDLCEARVHSLMLIYDVSGLEAHLWRIMRRNGEKYASERILCIR